MTITINQFAVLMFFVVGIFAMTIVNAVLIVLSKKWQKPRQNISEIKEIMEAVSGRNNRNFMPHEARRLMKDRGEKEPKET